MTGDTSSEMNKYYGQRGSIVAGSIRSTLTASKMPAKRKDPNEEFFKMSLLSFKLNHPKQAEILKINPDKLYEEVLHSGVPFYQWGDWIDSYLNKNLINKEYNRHALAKILIIENAR